MPWNNKSLRLRACRDLLHQRGIREPSFDRKISLIIEIIGLVWSPRNLSFCRADAAKLHDAIPTPDVEQQKLFALLDRRLEERTELVRNRIERREAKKTKKRRSQTSTPETAGVTTSEGQTPWDI